MPSRAHVVALAGLCAATLAGCGGRYGDVRAPGPCSGGTTVYIGSEEQPLSDGDEVRLVHGSQGGYHIELDLYATSVDAEVQTVVTVSHDDLLLTRTTFASTLEDDPRPDCYAETQGAWAILTTNPLPNPTALSLPDLLHELPIRVRALVISDAGAAADEVDLVIVWEGDDWGQ